MARRLPTVDGYTVDERLKEFRKMELGKEPEFIPFDSEKGEELFEKYQCCQEFCRKIDESILDEKKATQEYEDMSETANEHNEPTVALIFNTLSMDENKHEKTLIKLSMLVCGREM